jgi:CRP/FNR family transcriptional regulator
MIIQNRTECHRCGLCIGKISLFDNLSQEKQEQIMSHANHQVLPKGSLLFLPEDQVTRLIIIRQGKLKLSGYAADGREYIYDILTSGAVFGEDTIFSQATIGMYGEALSELHICSLSKDVLEDLLKQNIEFSIQLIRLLGKRSADYQETIRLLAIPDSKKRLEQFLVNRCDHLGHNLIELTRDTISSAIHMSRETVSRKLAEIERDGNIELIGYKKIYVKNKEKLKSH